MTQAPALQRVSHSVHAGLLAEIAIMIVTGPPIQWFGGRPFGIFDLVSFASPLAKSQVWHTRMADIHGFVARAIIWLLGLHLPGVIKHQFIDRDNLLARMTGRGKLS